MDEFFEDIFSDCFVVEEGEFRSSLSGTPSIHQYWT